MAALTGLRILDLTQYEAGPSCTQALAWLGAEVVKVESPGGGDPGRTLNPGYFQDSEYFMNWNSNKRSIVINLRDPKGRELLLELAPHFDVFIENFGPGVVEKLDIGYDVIKSCHPQVIYAQIKGFGLTGPYADYKCFDMVAQAAAGSLSITGEPDGPPMRPGPTLGDAGTGVQMALAITAAYAQKLRDGTGQHIELSMQEAVTYYMRTMIALGANGGTSVAPRMGNELDATVNLFPSKPFGKNDYVYIMSVTEPHWTLFCKTIGHPELATDPRFVDKPARNAHGAELKEIITAWTSQRTKKEAMRELCEAGIPASAVFDTVDIFSDPHLTSRGFVSEMPYGDEGKKIPLLGWPARMSKSSVPIDIAPGLGDHTKEVLQGELGLSADAVAQLVSAGVVV
ncbi:MAG: CaiB/BaiF CoA-transferase family protein [Proteobacteria bacterium]|nr:CaiB/BaiF CoA-transferase family protein [Pseudomonadota bacterium]